MKRSSAIVAFRIRFVKWERRPERHNAAGPFFNVYLKEEEHPIRSIHVLLGWSDIENLKHAMGLQGQQGEAPFERVMIRYAVQRIEHGLRENVFPPPSDTTDNLFFEQADYPFLRQLLQEKTCAYQLQEGRDLLCSAASAEDKTAHGKIGFRFVAPTSRAMCHTCTLPDTDYRRRRKTPSFRSGI